jgi:hypothetical protein
MTDNEMFGRRIPAAVDSLLHERSPGRQFAGMCSIPRREGLVAGDEIDAG